MNAHLTLNQPNLANLGSFLCLFVALDLPIWSDLFIFLSRTMEVFDVFEVYDLWFQTDWKVVSSQGKIILPFPAVCCFAPGSMGMGMGIWFCYCFAICWSNKTKFIRSFFCFSTPFQHPLGNCQTLMADSAGNDLGRGCKLDSALSS